jgi:hypothetical protein
VAFYDGIVVNRVISLSIVEAGVVFFVRYLIGLFHSIALEQKEMAKLSVAKQNG